MTHLSLLSVAKLNEDGYLYFDFEETSRTEEDLNDNVDQRAKRSHKSRQDRNKKHKDKPYSRTSKKSSKKSSKNAGQSVQTNTFYLCPKKFSSTNSEDDFIFKKPQVPPKRIIRKKKNRKE
ncbi:uncharacterized protein LOC142331006 [Lycorma delicatula]|uniref:uncharacterized protein LOC142331006 n=1 Tax=Lycorma delicatula TaxID=130591 RepID=UPI003F50E831